MTFDIFSKTKYLTENCVLPFPPWNRLWYVKTREEWESTAARRMAQIEHAKEWIVEEWIEILWTVLEKYIGWIVVAMAGLIVHFNIQIAATR